MQDWVEKVSEALKARQIKLVTAESCTGGMIAAAMTDRAGSSDVFERGFVTYSNDAKGELLGVQEQTLEQTGAVSQETALEMAAGALRNSHADIAVSVTGIAGPGCGSDEKPVGLVYIATALKTGKMDVQKHVFNGDRRTVRTQSCEAALKQVYERMEDA